MAVRVVLADDSYLIREGTARLLAGCDEVQLLGTVGDLPGLLALVDELRPDVVVTDIRMPPTCRREGIEAARTIRARHPQTGVLVLSQYAEEDYALELLGAGAAGLGYLLKDRVGDRDDLVAAVLQVAAGGSVLDPKVVEAVVVRRATPDPVAALTPREREVLEQMALGKSNAAIARTLFVTERAVEKHINGVFLKLGLRDEPDLHCRVMAVRALLRP